MAVTTTAGLGVDITRSMLAVIAFCTKSVIFSDNVARSLRSMANKATALAPIVLELVLLVLTPRADVEGTPSTEAGGRFLALLRVSRPTLSVGSAGGLQISLHIGQISLFLK